ncbi:MAG: hypothetical protein RJA70_2627, partial [Pseudomonadota bacterium]
MAIDLSHRLVHSGAVPRRDVEAALLRHAKHGVPFLKALLELRPQLGQTIEQEIERISGPAVVEIPPNADLVARLPEGLCARLLGYPIGFTPSTGVVDLLLADPLDRHALQEFGFHLRTQVRGLRGKLSFVTLQLTRLGGDPEPHTARQDGRHMNDKPAPLEEAEGDWIKPIPLVRLKPASGSVSPGTRPGIAPEVTRVRAPSESPKTKPGVAPAAIPALIAGSPTPPYGTTLPERGAVRPSEALLGVDARTPRIPDPVPPEEPRTSPGVAPPSGRGGLHGPPRVVVDARRPRVFSHDGDVGEASGRSRPPSPVFEAAAANESTLFGNQHAFQTALSELAISDSPDAVVDALVLGLGSVCREVIVLAPKGDRFRSRARADGEGNPERFTGIETSGKAPGAISEAVESGQYLGEPSHEDRALFVRRPPEVCATRITVSGRVALVLCAAGFVSSFEVTRRSDQLCRAAADALSRILLARK